MIVFVVIFIALGIMVFSFGPEKFIYTTGYCLKVSNDFFSNYLLMFTGLLLVIWDQE